MRIGLHSQNDQRGMALVLGLMALLIVAGIATLMFTRTINEVRHSGDDARIVQTLMLARGGANVGSALMASDAKAELYDIVLATARPGRWSYGRDPVSGVASSAPEPASVAADLTGVASRLQSAIDALVCGVNVLGGAANSTVSVRIHFTQMACNGATALPSDVSIPGGRYVSGPARTIEDVGVQEYALPFVMVSEAELGDYRRNIIVQGEYVFSVGEAPFSHYAYFTNRETNRGDPSNANNRIFFTNNTLIDGPTHTNGNFSIHLSPWFGGSVTSVGCRWSTNKTTYRNDCVDRPNTRTTGAYFNGRNSMVESHELVSPTTNRPQVVTNNGNRIHEPEFTAGVAWDAQYVPLPINSDNQHTVALGDSRDDQGLILDGDWDSVTMFAGNEAGDQPTLSGGAWTPRSTHQYITAVRTTPPGWVEVCTGSGRNRRCNWEYQAGSTVELRYRFDESGLLQLWNAASNSWESQPKPFNGVIYVSGDIERLRGPLRSSGDITSETGHTRVAPAVAHFAQMTLAGPGNFRITSDLKYEDPPCSAPPRRENNVGVAATCNNLAARNVLGIFTSNGDIMIGNQNWDSTLNAPHHLHLHTVLMSASNQVRVENWDSPGRGNVYLLGGLIQENRGIFGQVGGNGYDRVFTYDPRMRLGMAPPFFPTTGLGSVQDVRYFSFGQREQLY